MARARLITAVFVACASVPACAAADPTARMSAAFSPERLGAPTALSVGLAFAGRPDDPPPPLASIDLHYPPNLGLARSDLGVASCAPVELELEGPSVCPADSRVGSGSAVVEFPIAHETREEAVKLALVAGPSTDGRLHVLVSAIGERPIYASIVMPAVLLRGELHVTVPPIPGLPEGPDVSLLRMQITVGGDLAYTERVRGRIVHYQPRGISVPGSCPRGGFAFVTGVSFLDGSESAASATIPCPRSGRRRRRA